MLVALLWNLYRSNEEMAGNVTDNSRPCDLNSKPGLPDRKGGIFIVTNVKTSVFCNTV
jgi:hypothetical protein